MTKRKSTAKDNARASVTESEGYTSGRARTERRIASGNRRSGAAAAIKGVSQKPKGRSIGSSKSKNT